MKRLKYLLLITLVFFTGRIHGDIIILEPTPAKIDVRIENLLEFPDVVVIAVSNCLAFSNSNKAYRVESNACLKVNKACPLSLYVMKLADFNQADLDEIDWDEDKNVQKLNLTVKAESFKTSEYSSLEVDFNLANRNDTAFYLYRKKMTYKYKKERPDLVEYYEDNIVDPFKPIAVSTKNAF